jgi:acyl-CoA synthetase (AMP-forming)/AMP-acid ligase II
VKLAAAEPIPADVRNSYIEAGLWNNTLLRDGVELQAQRGSSKIALIDHTSRWTYDQLERAIARATGHLHRRGVSEGSTVLIVAPLVAAAVAAYHAVVRSGGVAVMLDRRVGRADVVHAIDSADIDLVVATSELCDRLELSTNGPPVITYDELLTSEEICRDWSEPDPERPIAVVFTSGTTSQPKGVVHSLNTLRSAARNMAEAVQLTGDDAAFLSSPLASVTGLVQIHLTLDRGAALLLEEHFDPASSLVRIQREGATVLGGAPVILEALLRRAASQQLSSLPLRAICLGGDMMRRSLLDLAVDRYGITPVRMYGSSEVPCATTTLARDLGEDRVRDDGACATGTELRTDGELVGELLVRGPVRFLGYLDEKDNAETLSAGGWYRTGDLGRYEDGRLTVTGRLKETVSRKGLKISLAEIDSVTSALPGVHETVAYGVPDHQTGERLAIAVYAAEPDAIDFDAVIEWLLNAGLAKWKLPEQIVVWDSALPRTETGKVQRRIVADCGELRPTLVSPRLANDLQMLREKSLNGRDNDNNKWRGNAWDE